MSTSQSRFPEAKSITQRAGRHVLKRSPEELQSAVDVRHTGHRPGRSTHRPRPRCGVDAIDYPAKNRAATLARTSVPPELAMEAQIFCTKDRNTEPARLVSANDEIPQRPQWNEADTAAFESQRRLQDHFADGHNSRRRHWPDWLADRPTPSAVPSELS
jgi:hypothetical protein